MKVVLAEKPSVAKDLAAVLGATGKGAGYFEGNGYAVTWAIGHLVELADTKDYGYGGWQLSNLPIIPKEFITKVTSDQGRAKQFAIIADLFQKADAIICATDAGREGELIFRYIYEQVGARKPIQRLWVSSQTDKALKDGFAKLKDGSEYDNLYHAARCRSEADWLVGINATQYYTLQYGRQAPFFDPQAKKSQPLSLGRVQTPILKLLVDRYLEAVNFKPETYWELILTLEKDGQQFQAKWFRDKMERFNEPTEGEAILAKLEDKALVKDVQKKPKTEGPPLLYDLTTLQKDANKRYNFSAQHTLDLAQDLYEKYKTLTYPRTDSRYLSDDIFPLIPDLLDKLAKVPAYAPFVAKARALGITKDNRYFNNAKVSDHHAIIPTETDPTTVQMSPEHYMIYDMVVRRFLGIFLGNCQKELSDIVLENAGELFRAKGTMISVAGWREIYTALEEALEKRKAKAKGKADAAKADDKDKEEEDALPFMTVGDLLPVMKKELIKKKTKAPSIHTESSILAMMETAGKEMEDEELREAMKEKGLGTPATRAGMIERLLERAYIARDKKKLIPTERGIALIGLVSDKPIASPELTGEWEMRLNKMAKGQYAADLFMQEVKKYTHEVVSAGHRLSRATGSNGGAEAVVMPDYDLPDSLCPKCKEGKILKGKRAFGCSRYKEGCDFTLRPLIAGKMVEQNHLQDLLALGHTQGWVQGFTNKAGKRFDARLRLKEDFTVSFDFGSDSSPKAPAT